MTLIDSFLIGLGVRPELGGLDKFKGAVMNTVKVVGGIALAFKAAQGLVNGYVLGMANDLDGLSDAAGRVGASVSELDKLEFIASQTDSSAEAARNALLGISRAAGQAALGMKESQESFDKLGVKIKDSNGKIKDSTKLFYEVSDALKKLDKSQQLAYARKFRLDPTIIATMTSDIGALQEQYDAFAKAAGVDLETAAQASSDLMDEVGKFGKLSQMVMRSVMTGFILKLKDSFIALRKWLLEHADTVKKVIQAILAFIDRMAGALGATFSRFGMIFSRMADWWGTLDDKTQKLILSVLALVAAWKLLNLQWLMSPIGMVVAALTGLFLIWDDLMTYMEGGESLIDWGPWMDDILAVSAVLQEIWDKLKEFAAWVWESLDFAGIWEGLKTQLAGVKKAFLGAFGFLKGLFAGDFGEAEAGFKKFWDGIITFFEGQGQVLLGVIKNILKLIGDAFGVDLSSVVTLVENIFGDLIETARNIIEPLADIVGGVVNTVAALFRGDFSGAVEAAGDVVKSVFDGIKAIILGAISIFEDLVNFILKAFGVDVKVTFDSLKNFVEWVFDGITKVVDVAKEALSVAVKTITGVIEGLLGILKDAWNWIKKVTGFGKTEEEEKADFEDRVLREKFTTRESYDVGGGIYAERTSFDEEGYKKAKAERDAQRAAESGGASQPTAEASADSSPRPAPPATVPAAPPAASTSALPFTAASVEVQDRPLVTEATRAGNSETKNITNNQNNNVNVENNITVNGSGDPEEVAERVVELSTGPRHLQSPIMPDTAYGGAG